LITVWFC